MINRMVDGWNEGIDRYVVRWIDRYIETETDR